MSSETNDGALAAIVLAPSVTDGDATRVHRMVDILREAGASPIVVAQPKSVPMPIHGRLVSVKDGSTTITAIRLAMSQLANTPARAVLLWPVAGDQAQAAEIHALARAAAEGPDRMVALEDADLDRSPIVLPRDAWLELMTLGEHGMGAVGMRRGVDTVRA